MSYYNWINANDYTMNCFLFFDRWALRYILNPDEPWRAENGENYITLFAKALCPYPHVKIFCRRKCPERADFLDRVDAVSMDNVTADDMRRAEVALLEMLETFVVYAYPDVMNNINYIRNWDEKYLHRLCDLRDKVVLDVGAGTGRLAFAAAKYARRVYASEPCDMLREYMRDRIKAEGITNMKVLDGEAADLPFEDNTFDIILSGHVVGDDYDAELAEMSRVCKDGGCLVCCNGDDEFKRTEPDEELVKRGFSWYVHDTVEGGRVYDYVKKVRKKEQLFDNWANHYDRSVEYCDAQQAYPFAGYADTLQYIEDCIAAASASTVLDLGFGTGELPSRLYNLGCRIYGQDFSAAMLAIAKEKMPDAHLFAGDFSQGLSPELTAMQYDVILSTYALHHLTDTQQRTLMRTLMPLLGEKGCILIGDVAFETREALQACRIACGDEWDEAENYPVFEEWKVHFPKAAFHKTSFCAGVLILPKA